jgi:hypothetical protein
MTSCADADDETAAVSSKDKATQAPARNGLIMAFLPGLAL